MENKSLIKLDDVTVKFKEHLVLDKVCMEFESGKIYGIIGRNGSGKTVLLKCICGLMDTTNGTVSVNGKIVGKDVDFPENIGFIIENPGFLPHYSGFKNLKYLASIRGTITDDDIRLSRLDLPQPVEPMMAVVSPGFAVKLMCSSASLSAPGNTFQ